MGVRLVANGHTTCSHMKRVPCTSQPGILKAPIYGQTLHLSTLHVLPDRAVTKTFKIDKKQDCLSH
jgi:hypothetical protein